MFVLRVVYAQIQFYKGGNSEILPGKLSPSPCPHFSAWRNVQIYEEGQAWNRFDLARPAPYELSCRSSETCWHTVGFRCMTTASRTSGGILYIFGWIWCKRSDVYRARHAQEGILRARSNQGQLFNMLVLGGSYNSQAASIYYVQQRRHLQKDSNATTMGGKQTIH